MTTPGTARAVRANALDNAGDDTAEIIERIAQRAVKLLAERDENVPTDEGDTKPDAGEQPPANESKPKPGEPSSADTPAEDDEDNNKPKNFAADEATKHFIQAFHQSI